MSWSWARVHYSPVSVGGHCRSTGAEPTKQWDELEIDQRCAPGFLSSFLSLSSWGAWGLFPRLSGVCEDSACLEERVEALNDVIWTCNVDMQPAAGDCEILHT